MNVNINNIVSLNSMDRRKLLLIARLNLNVTICQKIIAKDRRRRFQVHPINRFRPTKSEFLYFDDLLLHEDRFKSYLRMDIETFYRLLGHLRLGYICLMGYFIHLLLFKFTKNLCFSGRCTYSYPTFNNYITLSGNGGLVHTSCAFVSLRKSNCFSDCARNF